MKIVAISDNHCQNLLTKWDLPEGDVLVHAGDLTAIGDERQIEKMARQLSKLGERYYIVIFVPGNHDKLFANDRTRAINIMNSYGVTTLIDEGLIFNGINFYGTPWMQLQPEDLLKLEPEAVAFSRLDCRERYDRIPSSTHVLVTHQPPGGILDKMKNGENIGSSQLASAIHRKLDVMSHPVVFIFGHNHTGHGMVDNIGRRFYNVSLCDEKYQPCYEPTVITL